GVAEAEGAGLVGVGLPLGAIDLGGDDADGRCRSRACAGGASAQAALAQQAGDLLIARGDAGLGVNAEEDEVSGGDRLADLPLDVAGEAGEVGADLVVALALGGVDAETAGVDEFDGLVRPGAGGMLKVND